MSRPRHPIARVMAAIIALAAAALPLRAMDLPDPLIAEDGSAITSVAQWERRRGTIGLEAGLHAIRIEYMEASGEEVLDLDWTPPASPRGDVPAARYRRDRFAQIDAGASLMRVEHSGQVADIYRALPGEGAPLIQYPQLELGEGFDYTGAQFDTWCRDAGFVRTEVIPLAGPSSAAIAYKDG